MAHFGISITLLAPSFKVRHWLGYLSQSLIQGLLFSFFFLFLFLFLAAAAFKCLVGYSTLSCLVLTALSLLLQACFEKGRLLVLRSAECVHSVHHNFGCNPKSTVAFPSPPLPSPLVPSPPEQYWGPWFQVLSLKDGTFFAVVSIYSALTKTLCTVIIRFRQPQALLVRGVGCATVLNNQFPLSIPFTQEMSWAWRALQVTGPCNSELLEWSGAGVV